MIATTRFEDDIRYARVLCEDAKEQTKPNAHKFEAKLRCLASLRFKEYRIVRSHLRSMLDGREDFFYHDLTRQLFSSGDITRYMIAQKLEEIQKAMDELHHIVS